MMEPMMELHPTPWTQAREAARHLEAAVYRLSRRFPAEEAQGLTESLRSAATALAVQLELGNGDDSPNQIEESLETLWRLSHLADLAERLGYLDLAEAVELLALGSRVEIPLVALLRGVEGGQPVTARAVGAS